MVQTLKSYNPIQQWKTREVKVDSNGYVLVKVPEHPKSFRGGWYYEHRLVAEKHLNRLLKNYETIHHINETKSDNREINLFVCNREEHNKAHS